MKKILLFCLFIVSCRFNAQREILETYMPKVLDTSEKIIQLLDNEYIGKIGNTPCQRNTGSQFYTNTIYLSDEKVQLLLKPILNMQGVEFIIIDYIKKEKKYKILPSVPEFCSKYQEVNFANNLKEEASINNLVYTTRQGSDKKHKVINYLRFFDGGGFIQILIILKA